ncbi:hypothetical protein [Mesorhizobium loti]|uniref:hypothetical protein n=1 Tax=Rhizobium loti TaxID=381 RepID=UPI001C028C29|nr:hypothetical protein [Mesorhizobium loti]
MAAVDSLRSSFAARSGLALGPDWTHGTLWTSITTIAGETTLTLRTDGAGDTGQAVATVARKPLFERDEAAGETLHSRPDIGERVRLRLLRRRGDRPVLDRRLRHERAPMPGSG